MENAKELLKSHIELAEKVLIEFSTDASRGAKALDALRSALGKNEAVDARHSRLYAPAVYNALATINSVPNTKILSVQLIEALKEAKAEMQAIYEMM